jgi:hypothetical protein
MGSNLCMKWEFGNLFLFIRVAFNISNYFKFEGCFCSESIGICVGFVGFCA